jgi:CRISPR/Cas system-associated endonuclease Cas3-HD
MSTSDVNYKQVCVRLACRLFVQREVTHYLRDVLNKVLTEEMVNTMLDDSKIMFEQKINDLSTEGFQQLVNKEILDALKD